ncbi:MAG: hypothetical protein ABID38_04850 [Candidatus Diapherotrites archaeon]
MDYKKISLKIIPIFNLMVAVIALLFSSFLSISLIFRPELLLEILFVLLLFGYPALGKLAIFAMKKTNRQKYAPAAEIALFILNLIWIVRFIISIWASMAPIWFPA